jgi:TolB-like protein/Tfp pilus assembly protein PilF
MATVSVELRPAHVRSGDRTGPIARLLAPRPPIPSLFDLSFQRPDEMSWQRMVGRLQPLARTHSATVQHAPSGNAGALEVRVSCCRRRDRLSRAKLPIFHLAQADANHLVGGDMCHARDHRAGDGDVFVRARHGCLESRRFCSGCLLLENIYTRRLHRRPRSCNRLICQNLLLTGKSGNYFLLHLGIGRGLAELKTFVQELKNRRVYRVAIGYVVAAGATVQVIGTIMPIFHAPDWAQQIFVVLVAAGFPIALVLAWCFDIESGGIKLTGAGPEDVGANRQRIWVLAAAGCLVAGSAVTGYWLWHPWRPAPRVEPNVVAAIPEKSIAVLPFDNLSDEKQYSFLADGFQDEILTNLAKVADLKVISRTSVMQYKSGIERNLREIAKALGVAHVLEGTVQRADGRVRVNAQLIDARTDTQLWAERYDRNLADVFAIESEVAEKIVDQLKSKLSPEEKAAIKEQPTADLDAFARYTRAKQLIEASVITLQPRESVFEAIDLLNQAIQRDPNFALAYYQLATAHDYLYFVGIDHTPARLAMAEAAINSLIGLRPNSGEAHLARARHFYWGSLDYDRSREELRLAQKSLPNDPYPPLLNGYMDRRQGRWEESIKNLERAIELDPQNRYHLQQVGRTYELLRRYPDAERALDRAVALDPQDGNLRASRAEIEVHWHADPGPLGSTIDAILAENPGEAKNIAQLWVQLAAYRHDTAAAQRAIAALPEDGCHDDTVPFPRTWCEGLVAGMRGDKHAARAAFTKAREETTKLLHNQPDYAEGLTVLGMADAFLGHKDPAIREGRRAVELLPMTKDAVTGALLSQYLAIIYAWSGEKDLALQELTKAAQTPGFISYGKLRLDPYWDPLRADPRFDQIVNSLAPK